MADFGAIGRWLGGKRPALDGFVAAEDDPLAAQHVFLSETLEKWPDDYYWRWDKSRPPADAMAPIKAASTEERRRLILAILPRLKDICNRRRFAALSNPLDALHHMLDWLMKAPPDLREAELHALTDWMIHEPGVSCGYFPVSGTIRAAETLVAQAPLSAALKQDFAALAAALRQHASWRENRLAADRIDALIGVAPIIHILPGEAWADAALADLAALPPERQTAWGALLAHGTVTAGKPTGKWIKEAGRLLKEAVPFPEFKTCLLRWLPLVEKPRTQPLYPDGALADRLQYYISEANADVLKGLAWFSGLTEDRELARALTALALTSYKKLPGIGPRAVRVGNACVTAFGLMPGLDAVGQLALLKARAKVGAAQKEIEKALAASARLLGLPASELEEMSVPAYGLERVGETDIPLGDHTALLRVEGNAVRVEWRKPDGKKTASAPATVKTGFAADLKELKSSVKDIERMLPAQRERLDGLFLKRKSWPINQWRERYLDHPLVGTLARRLIWRFTAQGDVQAGIFFDGRLVSSSDGPLADFGPETRVELWHPLDQAEADILAWRDWLERHRVQQPFKQAHREVYLLTDAERRTRVYSNRFAAHLLKQHQFNALCGARGWKNQLRLMYGDGSSHPSLALPEWNLRAEFWVEGAGGNDGRDTNDTGVYLHLATDQVRFHPLDAAQSVAHTGGADEPIPLEDIPPLVLSEVMRDVDLFVGVASVGNDPNWADGGPEGRYRDYWQSYAFGDLSSTAKTRKDILARLLPRLKIAGRAALEDRFLVVRGDLRTYKIHLGSGNILMSPNDAYLCIVPKGANEERSSVFLPFEGDRLLSIILSKAFLLAADTKIADPTIISQIKR